MAKLISDATKRYADTLLSEVLMHAETEGSETFLVEAFTDLILDDLEQEGAWPDYHIAHHHERGAEVSAYGFDPERRILFLSVTAFERDRTSFTISPTDVQAYLRRLHGFVSRARAGKLDVPEHNPVDDLIGLLNDSEAYDELRFLLLTDRVASELAVGEAEVDGVPVMQEVRDLESIRRTRTTGERLDPIHVELGDGLPYLGRIDAFTDVTSLLFFLPAPILARMYNEHGGRLLERNVRAFLSARGKVNRGIRDTIQDEPERFLAYNNGLTATAAKIDTGERDGIPVLLSIHDLQIVNGGQTTASLASASREGTDISAVEVQVKLVVIDGPLIDEMVPNISRFANRQNAVQESDLTSNNEYLRRLEEASRTEWTPHAVAGRPTKWYFERARGSFGVDLAGAGTKAQQDAFLTDYPKGQKFTKNDMAVYENTWACLPHLVSRGGQKNYAEFMERLPEPPTSNESKVDAWHRARFKELVGKAILFREADGLVRKHHGGAYKRQVVSYSLAWLLQNISPRPDLELIWATQSVSTSLSDAIVDISGQLKNALVESAAGRNVAEWAKQPACWEHLQNLKFHHDPVVTAAPKQASTSRQRAARKPSGRSLVELVGKDPIRSRTGMLRSLHGDLALTDAVEAALGIEVPARSRRQKRRCWLHIGDTGVPAPSGTGTLHAFAGKQPEKRGPGYLYTVLVDPGAREVLEIEWLKDRQLAAVLHWLDLNGIPRD